MQNDKPTQPPAPPSKPYWLSDAAYAHAQPELARWHQAERMRDVPVVLRPQREPAVLRAAPADAFDWAAADTAEWDELR